MLENEAKLIDLGENSHAQVHLACSIWQHFSSSKIR